MKAFIKNTLKRHLSPGSLERLREARRHLQGLMRSLNGGLDTPADYALTARLEGESFLCHVGACAKATAGPELDECRRSLMQRIILRDELAHLAESRYLQSLLGASHLREAIQAAACYGRGDPVDAAGHLQTAVRLCPDPFYFLCLSRCVSHGLGDDRVAAQILERGLRENPGHPSLILSLAGAHFRQGRTALANEHLDSIRDHVDPLLEGSGENANCLAAEIAAAIRQKLTIRPKDEAQDRYSDSFIQGYWNILWYHMNTFSRFQDAWARLDDLYQERIGRILTDLDPGIRGVINFGVFCANPDYRLALRFPEKQFIGVDRDALTKELNEKAFLAPNLRFLAADLLEVLPRLAREAAPSLLFHARTATLCYPDFLRAVYQTCAREGVEYVALFENFAISRTTRRFHDFKDLPADSIPFRQVMFIHNYEKLLEEAGYRVLNCERICNGTDLFQPDEHVADAHVWLVAKRER